MRESSKPTTSRATAIAVSSCCLRKPCLFTGTPRIARFKRRERAHHRRAVPAWRGGPLPGDRDGARGAGLRDPRRANTGDLANRQRDVRCRHELAVAYVHVAVGVEAFGVLAHHHEIDGLAEDTRRHAGRRLRRAHVGVEVETLAQRIADVCLTDTRVEWTEVTVHKPHAPIEATFSDVALTITRSRQ